MKAAFKFHFPDFWFLRAQGQDGSTSTDCFCYYRIEQNVLRDKGVDKVCVWHRSLQTCTVGRDLRKTFKLLNSKLHTDCCLFFFSSFEEAAALDRDASPRRVQLRKAWVYLYQSTYLLKGANPSRMKERKWRSNHLKEVRHQPNELFTLQETRGLAPPGQRVKDCSSSQGR